MQDAVSEALFQPFRRGLLGEPSGVDGRRWLYFNAAPAAALDDAWRQHLLCLQPGRVIYDSLVRAGFEAADSLPQHRNFAGSLVRLGRDRHEGRGLIAEAWQAVPSGGTIVIAGAKDEGGQSHERDVAALVGLDGVMPKGGCRIFWLTKPATPPEAVDAGFAAWRAAAAPRRDVVEGFFTQAGLFSWQAIDAGSRFLAAHLPAGISGPVAELGCGWGYLAARLMEHCPDISALDLYEVDRRALACAERNLAGMTGASRIAYFWHNVTAGLADGRTYRWIISNPPFHRGRAAEPKIGQAFIKAAARALAPRGRLLIVANRQLPYERTLGEIFSEVSKIADDGAYKIIEASLPRPQASSSGQRSRRR